MKVPTRSTTTRTLIFTAAAAVILFIAGTLTASAQQYKPGDRVECETTGTGKWWSKGTIMPFQKGDFPSGMDPDGSWFRFKADSNKVEYPCKPEFIRPIAGAAAAVKAQPPVRAAGQNNTNNNETAAAGKFLDCPISQKQVRNGAAPTAELFKKIIRCKKGEKAVDEGDEGAVGVEISAMQIGASRLWRYADDSGSGKVGTLVYPVKATLTVRTFYRNATEVEEGAVRILNFYVNAFGEWAIGSEELIKGGKAKRIPKD